MLVIDELEDLDVTVSRWTDEELDEATHLEDLPLRDHGFVWIDARHRGVGSAAVGPDVGPAHPDRTGYLPLELPRLPAAAMTAARPRPRSARRVA